MHLSNLADSVVANIHIEMTATISLQYHKMLLWRR